MPITGAEFEYVRSTIYAKAGIVLEAGKEYLVETRLAAVVRREKLAGVSQLIARLRASPYDPLHKAVLDCMTTNETSFFRDIKPFEALRTTVIPELMKRRMATRTLNFWCAAASTGQEPYTICMTLREHFPQLADWRLTFVATDLSRDVLERARSGRYTQMEVNRGLPAAYLMKYFQRAGMEWQIKDELRRMVDFRELNLLEPLPAMGMLDVVFIRNVLIYFDVPTKQQIFKKIRTVLRPDGCMFLGGAETTLNVDESFTRCGLEHSGCYALKAAALAKAA
jgi:chemotaxis protein methyltransferase CheR